MTISFAIYMLIRSVAKSRPPHRQICIVNFLEFAHIIASSALPILAFSNKIVSVRILMIIHADALRGDPFSRRRRPNRRHVKACSHSLSLLSQGAQPSFAIELASASSPWSTHFREPTLPFRRRLRRLGSKHGSLFPRLGTPPRTVVQQAPGARDRIRRHSTPAPPAGRQR